MMFFKLFIPQNSREFLFMSCRKQKPKAEITRDVTKGDKMALFPDDEEFIKALPPGGTGG